MLSVLVIQVHCSVRKPSAVEEKETENAGRVIVIRGSISLSNSLIALQCLKKPTDTLTDSSWLTLDTRQFLMTPLINCYRLTLTCASYISHGRVAEFVFMDVAPSHPHHPTPDRIHPALACSPLHCTTHPVPRRWAQKGKKSGGGWWWGPRLHGLVTHFLSSQACPTISW